MFPNRMESTNQTRLPAVARAHCDVFQAGFPWQGMENLYKGSIFCHHGDTICHPKSGYVTTKLHGTSRGKSLTRTPLRIGVDIVKNIVEKHDCFVLVVT